MFLFLNGCPSLAPSPTSGICWLIGQQVVRAGFGFSNPGLALVRATGRYSESMFLKMRVVVYK